MNFSFSFGIVQLIFNLKHILENDHILNFKINVLFVYSYIVKSIEVAT